MKVSDVIHGRVATAHLRRADGDRFPEGLVKGSEVLLSGGDHDRFRIRVGEDAWGVEGVDPADVDTLRRMGIRSLPRIAWLVQVAPGRGSADRLLLQVHEFPAALDWGRPMDIGVDDRVVEDMRKRQGRLVSVESVVQWLKERVLLPSREPDGPPRALLSGSPRPDAGRKTAFRLYGDRVAVDVEGGSDNRLQVNRVVSGRRAVEGDERRPMYLATGQISFCDATVAGEFRGVARTELDSLVAQSDSYLGLWQAYNKREREAILRRARELGWARYSRREPLPGGAWCFDLDLEGAKAVDFRRRLKGLDRDQLQAGEEVPAVIQGADDEEALDGPRRPFTGELVAMHDRRLTLRPPPDQEDREPPSRGFIFLGLGGDEVRINRRGDAWQRIRGCANPMPQLGMMLEGQPVRERRGRRLKPVTKAVRDVFRSPNDRQRLALDVALNTPDIALVQGPPGTGKTRVIAALQARLAEQDEGVDPGGLSGSTLLTSFQHDAVENAAAATRVMGLPAVKVGYRRGSDEARDGVEAWATETVETVRAARVQSAAEDSVHAALRSVHELAVAYLKAASGRDEPTRVLRRVSEAAGPWLPGELSAAMGELRAELSGSRPGHIADDDRAFALKAVRAIRTEAVPFSDDGPANAYKALRRLGRVDGFTLACEERSCLEEAADVPPDSAAGDDLLGRLRATRDALIDRMQPAADGPAAPRTHADVERVVMRVIDALSERAKETAAGADVAVAEWLSGLENDPAGTRETIRHYSMVLAATCQQSVSPPMADAMLGDDTVFRTVIVDEAARSNPLDLLIPMALAERRIVLVGDHRQLPHILEPDVERELEQSGREETQSALRQSLFEKLFSDLRRREKNDGVKRTVTLNTQYRMHPRLGRFVSEQFYEPHGEEFDSGRDEGDFRHDVILKNGDSLAGKVAVWIELSGDRGPESAGRSKRRPVEARRVADEGYAVVSRHPELSVGVVTFYAAQRDEILDAMRGVGLTESDDEGGLRVRDRWRRTSDGRERLRIGTVDAFQGKEFDVVFLSLTRSNRTQVKNEATRRRRYGFLLLENRLCVAMSRQHRLLVVVGDGAMAAGSDAESSVPALCAFRKLCEGPDGHVVRT